MTLILTPDILAAAYDYLRATPPFKGWKLPEADDVGFAVARDPTRHAYTRCYIGTKDADIHISELVIGSTRTLMEAMAHECIHFRQHLRKTETPNTEHNAEFRRIAARVCSIHGFDPKTF